MQCFEDNVRFNFHPNLSVPSVNANPFPNIKVTFSLIHKTPPSTPVFTIKESVSFGSGYFRPVCDGICFREFVLYTDNDEEKITVYYNVKALSMLLLYSVFFHLLDTASRTLNKSKHKQ